MPERVPERELDQVPEREQARAPEHLFAPEQRSKQGCSARNSAQRPGFLARTNPQLQLSRGLRASSYLDVAGDPQMDSSKSRASRPHFERAANYTAKLNEILILAIQRFRTINIMSNFV